MLSPKEKKFLKLYLAKLNPQELAEKLFIHIKAHKLTLPLFEIYEKAGVDLSLDQLFEDKTQYYSREKSNLLRAYQESYTYSTDLFEIKIFKKLVEQIPEAQKGKMTSGVLDYCLDIKGPKKNEAVKVVLDLTIAQLAKECAEGAETNFIKAVAIIHESKADKKKEWIEYLRIQKEQRVLSLLLAPKSEIVLAKEKAFKL